MTNRRSRLYAIAALSVTAFAALGYQATGAPGSGSAEVWSFEMWCLDMQLYPAKRCDARTAEDLHEYDQYRTDVEKYHGQQQDRLKHDQDILDRLNRNLPGSATGAGR
jgi:hypothetical protein